MMGCIPSPLFNHANDPFVVKDIESIIPHNSFCTYTGKHQGDFLVKSQFCGPCGMYQIGDTVHLKY